VRTTFYEAIGTDKPTFSPQRADGSIGRHHLGGPVFLGVTQHQGRRSVCQPASDQPL